MSYTAAVRDCTEILRHGARTALIFGAMTIFGSTSASAQGFTAGSSGIDGSPDLSCAPTPCEILFDPASFEPPLDQDQDSIYEFTSLHIPAGVTVRLLATSAGTRPIHWLASGAVVIDGVLDLSGADGHPPTAVRAPSIPGPGGFPGGFGATPFSPAELGFGPGASPVLTGAAGHATAGWNGGPLYGNAFLLPLIGGSGGSGASNQPGPGGGAGGGAILIASDVSISVDGEILANGGNGGDSCCVAGGGSGGAIRLITPQLTGAGAIRADAGHYFAGTGSGTGRGGVGRVRIETADNLSTGTVSGDTRLVSLAPDPVLISASSVMGELRVASIGGVAVPAQPFGSFNPADVVVDSSVPQFGCSIGAECAVVIEATNVPAGTEVQITVANETEGGVVHLSAPLAGTDDPLVSSTSVRIPPGFSLITTRATFTP